MLIDPLTAPARLLEVSHVAHRLSASPGFVRQLIRSKELPAIRLGSRWRVDPADLQGFIDARRNAERRQQIAAAETALDVEFAAASRASRPARRRSRRPAPVDQAPPLAIAGKKTPGGAAA